MGKGPLTASLEDTLCSTISSPSWGLPLGLEGCSPLSQIHSQRHRSPVPSTSFWERTDGFISNLLSWGTRDLSSNLSPTCCHLPVQVLCLSSSELQPGQGPEGKWVEPGSILCISPPPPPARPVLTPSAAAPSSSRPPGQSPPSLPPPARPVRCLFSENQTRDWGEGEDPRRGSGI